MCKKCNQFYFDMFPSFLGMATISVGVGMFRYSSTVIWQDFERDACPIPISRLQLFDFLLPWQSYPRMMRRVLACQRLRSHCR